jgi:hypothetical protein
MSLSSTVSHPRQSPSTTPLRGCLFFNAYRRRPQTAVSLPPQDHYNVSYSYRRVGEGTSVEEGGVSTYILPPHIGLSDC